MLDLIKILGAGVLVVFFFGFCIFIHELGHFLVAKIRGLHIVAFSLGFKKVWCYTHDGIEYRIGCIPCGGYVDIPQLDSAGEAKLEDGTVLPPAKPFDRMLTAFAGPLFNVFFGFALGTVVWIYGVPQGTPKMHAITVAEVEKESPEYEAGLREGDRILKINGKSFYCTWNGFIQKILFSIDDVVLTVKRGDNVFTVKYKPAENPNVMPGEKLAFPFFVPKIPVVLYPHDDSPASKAGIEDGDVILEIDGKKINNLKDFESIIVNSNGRILSVLVKRNGKEVRIDNLKPEPIQTRKLFMIGVKYQPEIPIVIGEVVKDSAASSAGLISGDVILQVDGNELKNAQDFADLIRESEGRALNFKIKRNDKIVDKIVTPKLFTFYTIGVDYAAYNYPSPWQQFVAVVDMTYKSLRGVIVGQLGKAGLTRKKSSLKPSHFMGPLGILKIIYLAFYKGSIVQGFYIIVLITFSLAILNLFPIPVLDGGHIVLACIEIVFRRPLSPKLVQPVSVAFIILLISFMIFVSYYDVKRYMRIFFGSSDKSKKQKTVPTEVNVKKTPGGVSEKPLSKQEIPKNDQPASKPND